MEQYLEPVQEVRIMPFRFRLDVVISDIIITVSRKGHTVLFIEDYGKHKNTKTKITRRLAT